MKTDCGTGLRHVNYKARRAGGLRHAGLLLLIACGCVNKVVSTPRATSAPASSLADVIKQFELDDRLTLCDVWQRPDGKLAGFVEMPQYREVLKAHGFDVSNVKLLPEESGTTDRFGFIAADHAILRKTPKDVPGDRENATDALRGETCWILDRKPDGWTLVHTADGYLGWAAPGMMGWQMDADAYQIHQRHAQLLDAAPRGFFSPAQFVGPDGPTTRPSTGIDAELAMNHAERVREMREVVCKDAAGLLGTPYVWGGKTAEGIDCSGLVQSTFARHGILLPRDAYQQSNVGKLVGTRWFHDGLLPGDLLFFVSPRRGNVHHVAIYTGDGKYIEAAGKDVHFSSMTPGDEGYDAKRAATFAWARRVIE